MADKTVPLFKNINELIAANKAIGQKFFDDRTMKYFNTKFVSPLIGFYFITSDVDMFIV